MKPLKPLTFIIWVSVFIFLAGAVITRVRNDSKNAQNKTCQPAAKKESRSSVLLVSDALRCSQEDGVERTYYTKAENIIIETPDIKGPTTVYVSQRGTIVTTDTKWCAVKLTFKKTGVSPDLPNDKCGYNWKTFKETLPENISRAESYTYNGFFHEQ